MTGPDTPGSGQSTPGSGPETPGPGPDGTGAEAPGTDGTGSGAAVSREDAAPSLEELHQLRELRPGVSLPGEKGKGAGPGSAGTSKDGESRIWPVPVFTLGMIVLSLVLLPAVSFRLGGVPEGDVRAQGSAEVRSCARSAAYVGLAYACDALVTWEDAPEIGRSGEAEPVERTVWSIEPLQGSVDVLERGARDEDHRVVPVDHPYRSWVPTAIMPAYFVFGIAGFLIGLRLMRKKSASA